MEEGTMKRLLLVTVIAALTAASSPAAAHEGHKHGTKVMGTVSAYHADMKHLEVKTAKGETVGVMLNDQTKIMKGTTAMTVADLRPGARVVVTYTGTGDQKTASEIRLGGATAKRTAAKTAPSHKH
jgi:hypothetical protein